jgi:hypothetical protein
LSSRSRLTIRCSFSIAFFSRSAQPLALSTNDCHKTTRSSATLQSCTIKQTSIMSWATYCQCVIDGGDAGPQGLHVLVIFKPVLLPRGVIPVNCAPWQPWARGQRWRYLCTRCSWTSWHQVNLRLVPDQVLCPTREYTDGVGVDDRLGGYRPDVPSGSSLLTVNFRQPRVLVIHWFRL